MIVRLNTKDKLQAEQIVNLQKKAYAVEAELIGSYAIPGLRETTYDIMRSDEIFYGYLIEDSLAGLISYKIDNNIMDIYRVAIQPDFFRRGIARKLLQFIEDSNEVEKIIVATGALNKPAISLYESFGFEKNDCFETPEGIIIQTFGKLFY